jgi:hypothetical protein
MSDKPGKITTSKVFAISTLLAVVISVPAISVTLVLHYVVKANLIVTGVGGIITLFIAMGFGYKLSKRLAAKVQDGSDLEKK